MKRSIWVRILIALLGCVPAAAYSAGFAGDFSAATGDINGDGLVDIYIKQRTGINVIPLDDFPIVVPGPSTVSPFILQRRSDQTFQIVANLSDAQRAAVAQWSVSSSIDLLPLDINLDGALDLLVKEIAGAAAQLVYADPRSRMPPNLVTNVGPELMAFLRDMTEWMFRPARIEHREVTDTYSLSYLQSAGFLFDGQPLTGNFFDQNTVPDACYSAACGFDSYLGWYGYFTLTYDEILYQTTFTSQDAYALTQLFDPSLQDVTLTAESTGAIAAILGRQLGGSFLSLGDPPPTEENTIPLPGQVAEAILLILSELYGGPTGMSCNSRYLTAGENQMFAKGNDLEILNAAKVRIRFCLPPFVRIFSPRTAVTPFGNIYLGQSIPARDDYSVATGVSIEQLSILVHELVHVFQYRSLHYSVVFRKLEALGEGAYCYKIDFLKNYYKDYNIESQAEMVQDRYLFRNGKVQSLLCNTTNGGPNAFFELEKFIPLHLCQPLKPNTCR